MIKSERIYIIIQNLMLVVLGNPRAIYTTAQHSEKTFGSGVTENI